MAKIDLSKEFCYLPNFVREDIMMAQTVGQQFGWQIQNFDLPSAWKDTCGTGVKVAVLDTGVDLTHPDLIENLTEGYNVINPKRPPTDDNGHGCVSPDCLVQTSINGIERIEDLYNSLDVPERRVKHAEGEYTVKDVFAKTYSLDRQSQKTVIGSITSVQKLPVSGPVVEVELEGNIVYHLTPWHPVYLIKNRHHDVYDIVRKRADELAPGDQFLFGCKNGPELQDGPAYTNLPNALVCGNCGHRPRFKTKPGGQCKKCHRSQWEIKNRKLEITNDMAYLCGITLTDGHVSKDRFDVCSCTPEILDRVEEIAKSRGWTCVRESKRVLIYGRNAVETILSLGVMAGKKSLCQDLPSWVGQCRRELVYCFLAGVVDGDGSIDKTNTKNRITTASRCFAYKMAALMNAIGMRSSVSTAQFDRRNRSIKSNAPVFKINHGAMPLSVVAHLRHPIKIKRSQRIPKYERRGRTVKKVTQKHYEGYFYDFTVSDHHNYIADGHFVSNTHVAGIIAASNNVIGVVGVSPCAKIIPIKVLNRMGAGRMDHVIEGIKIAVDKGADLICMSLGTRNPLDEVFKAIKKAADAGVVCFVAAGNAGRTAQLLYPAAYDITISIGAVDENSMRASFSCTGPNLDFVAPGVDIYSTVPVSSYAVMSGTSQAAPFACGVGALLLSHHRMTKPGAKFKKEDYVKALSNNALTVENLDVKYAELGKRFFQGFGIINPVNFLDWVENKKVDSVAQTIAGALGDVGMLDTSKADVSALRKLSTDLNKALKQFPKVNQKAAAKKAAVQKEMISSALLRRVSKQPAHNPQP